MKKDWTRCFVLIGIVVICIALLMGVAKMAFGETYTVTVDDKYAPYFEASLDKDITPEAWLTAQAINNADMEIDRQYRGKEAKDRDSKIDVIKGE